MSIAIDEYLSSIGGISGITPQHNNNSPQEIIQETESQSDSYISSINNMDDALPCDNYNDILELIQRNKADMALKLQKGELSDVLTVKESDEAAEVGDANRKSK